MWFRERYSEMYLVFILVVLTKICLVANESLNSVGQAVPINIDDYNTLRTNQQIDNISFEQAQNVSIEPAVKLVKRNIVNDKQFISIGCEEGFVFTENSCDECGVSNVGTNLRIIGGITAATHSFPAHAYIVQTYSGYFRFTNSVQKLSVRLICGGTLINRFTVLTAAHCIVNKVPVTFQGEYYELKLHLNSMYPTWSSMFKVYLGAQRNADLNNPLEVQEIRIHFDFDPINALNDIALLLLKNKVQLSSTIQIACLPPIQSTSYPNINTGAYAIGWGKTSNTGEMSNSLQNIKVTVYDPNMCYDVAPVSEKDWNKQICAGDMSGTKSICKGDSGGGMYIFDIVANKSKFVIAGIISYVDGSGCAVENKPNVYTKVSPYLKWIRSNWKEYPKVESSKSTENNNMINLWCFSKDNTVTLENNSTKSIMNVNVGDKVKSTDSNGNIVYSEVVAILHKNKNHLTSFIQLKTQHNATITLTKKHLLYVKNREGYIGADQVNVNEIIEIYDEKRNKLIESRVVSIDDNHHDLGYITPLTDNGVILVNNVHASCFAHVTSHQLSLLSMKPFIFAYKLSNYLNISTWFNTIDNTSSSIHFYAKYLLDLAQNYLSFFLIY